MVKGEELLCYKCMIDLTEKDLKLMEFWEEYCGKKLKNKDLRCANCFGANKKGKLATTPSKDWQHLSAYLRRKGKVLSEEIG